MQVSCLFLGGRRHHRVANETTVAETEPLGDKTSVGQRSTRDQRHTFREALHVERGRKSPQGVVAMGDSRYVKDSKTPLQKEQQETFYVQAAKTIAGTQTPVLPITFSEGNPWQKKGKSGWGGGGTGQVLVFFYLICKSTMGDLY